MDNEDKTTKYLYGAAVQGIQDFIFQTNKLKEIVGASEIVEQVCTTAFDKYAKKGMSIVRAAGNIKHIFDLKEDCKEAVLKFPKEVMTMAPGITISQAVVAVKIDKDGKIDLSDYALQSNELEKRLRTQRNKAVRPVTLGFMAVKRAPSTGLSGVRYDEKEEGGSELIDEASVLKRAASGKSFKLAKEAFRDNVKLEEIAFNIKEITDKNNWIAIIHADGNGLGNIFQVIGKNPDDMRKFSSKLDEITKISARVAFQIVERHFYKEKKKIPFRPVVLSGDDLTMICRADLAIEYTQLFLEEFERISIKELSELKISEAAKKILKEGLTACAGISFVKASYPFHYAVNLSESLCKRAKEKAKKLVTKEESKLPPSCLMFYKVQDSFITDIKEIIARTLTPQEKISLEFGPYYCGKRAEDLAPLHADCGHDHTIDALMYKVDLLKSSEKAKALKSNLRQWLTCLFEDEGKANQRMIRIKNIGDPDLVERLNLADYTDLQKGEASVIPFYEMLSVASLNIETKSKKREEDKQ